MWKWIIKLIPAKLLIRKAFEVLNDIYVENISDPILRDLASDNIERGELSAIILVDNDPDNAEQFRQLWRTQRKDILCDTLGTSKLAALEFLEGDARDVVASSIDTAIKESGCPAG